MSGKTKHQFRMRPLLAAFLFAAFSADAQAVTLPPSHLLTVLHWISVGTARDAQDGEMQVYYADVATITPRDKMVAIAVVFSSQRMSATSEPYWGNYIVDRISCDDYSDLVPNDTLLFDDQGRVLQDKVGPHGDPIYATGRAPAGPNLHWERIPLGSPVEAVFRQICQ